ncbi:hypothetical protein HNY73_003697 [Argiope bruennichi]|uniref:Uncharacterized protein n=1 Tax=Argiope bruennichi TaxID=94029 RepID=A0A8T0FPF0_ARGBR|nr:hypothetical protein HNY73_003697 [Argiope bruennichi]
MKDRRFNLQFNILVWSSIIYFLLHVTSMFVACYRSVEICEHKSFFFGVQVQDPNAALLINEFLSFTFILFSTTPVNTFTVYFMTVCQDIVSLFETYKKHLTSQSAPDYQTLLQKHFSLRKLVSEIDSHISCIVFWAALNNAFSIYLAVYGVAENAGSSIELKILILIALPYKRSSLFMCHVGDRVSTSAASVAEEETFKTEDVQEEKHPSTPVEKSSPPNKPSEDSAVSSMDIPTPVDFMSDVKFEEEDMWLVEFPPNLPVAAKPAEKRSRLRRHSSVEVGHEIPFRLAAQKPPAENFLHPTMYGDPQISPRRFSESQARPDVVPLNKSFAAKVRRVLAKVRVNRDSDDQSSSETSSPQSSYKWPQVTLKLKTRKPGDPAQDPPTCRRSSKQKSGPSSKRFQSSSSESGENSNRRYGSDGNPIVKRILPTITESSSFDSLRDSPLMQHATTQPVVSMPNLDSENLTVVIDMTGAAAQDDSSLNSVIVE